MKLQDCNPFLRTAEIQNAVLEGAGLRRAYDHRIFYILEGEGALITEAGEFPLASDTLLLFRPAMGYHFKGKLRVIVLNFDLTRAEAHRTAPCPPAPIAEFEATRLFDRTTLEVLEQPIVRADQRAHREELLEIAKSFCPADATADAYTSALLKKLLAELFAPKKEQSLVRRIERYIELYAAEIADNEQIGRAFGYHPVYLATLFREQTGQSLHQAILHRRIALACRFLTQTEHSVEEIAFEVGFSSRSHFCTVFKREMGCSPKKYQTVATM